MPIAVGSKAPDFTLKSKNASGLSDVKLAANLGAKNTVILFFPLAFTGVCTQEFAQEAWATQHKIGITLASDLNKKTAEAYGVLLPDLIGLGSVSARAAFVIDKQGVVQYSEQTPTPKELPNFAAIKEVLAKLQ
jgi:glutaredoxin-dependent peroxiredoxin